MEVLEPQLIWLSISVIKEKTNLLCLELTVLLAPRRKRQILL